MAAPRELEAERIAEERALTLHARTRHLVRGELVERIGVLEDEGVQVRTVLAEIREAVDAIYEGPHPFDCAIWVEDATVEFNAPMRPTGVCDCEIGRLRALVAEEPA